jgi:hypothetical protein
VSASWGLPSAELPSFLSPGSGNKLAVICTKARKQNKGMVSHGLLLDLSYVKLNEENVFILPKTR